MITVFLEKCNTFSQKEYDNLIADLPLNAIKCPYCGHSGCFTIHGYYYRRLKICGSMIILRILRVKCSICGHTHAILPSIIIPYSQIQYDDMKKICEHYEAGCGYKDIMHANYFIDESNIAYILKNYRRYWREKILSWRMTITDDILRPCFDNVRRQFMQIKSTLNILFSPNHIT